MQYVQCTVYRIQTPVLRTDGVHVHFCYWIGWKDSTVLVIPSYPHPHPLRKTNHRWVCVAKLCFCLICTMGRRSILRTYSDAYGQPDPFLFFSQPLQVSLFPPRKPCDCPSTPRHMTRSLELSSRKSSADVWHPRQMWGTRPSENSILEVPATSLSTARLWDHMLRMHLWPQVWCHLSLKKTKKGNACTEYSVFLLIPMISKYYQFHATEKRNLFKLPMGVFLSPNTGTATLSFHGTGA